MKSAILYASHRPKKYNQGIVLQGNKCLWIRAQVVNKTAIKALDMAKPRKGEIVLNTIELPE